VNEWIEKAQDNYGELSGQASEHARKLCYVGFALIALFSGVQDESLRFPLQLPDQLVLSGFLLGVALGFDLLQYVIGAATWGGWARWKEKSDATPLHFPRTINWPSLVFYWAKIVATVAGWVILLCYVVPAVA
jgi:hypothetical protein